jgi:hypothetical protein
VRIWQDLSFSVPIPSPSGSDVKFAQNAKPEAVLELDDKLLELLVLDDEDELVDVTELTTVTGGVLLLPPPPPHPTSDPITHPTNAKLKIDLFKYIFILLKTIV